MSDYKTDYAPHNIEVRHQLKAMRDAFLKGQYEEAVTHGSTALVELRLAVIAIKDLAEKQKSRE